MTSFSLPDSRRRFLQVLWLSAALHAAVIGLTHLLPQTLAALPQTLAALPPELQVQLAQPVAPAQAPPPQSQPEPPPQTPQPTVVPVTLPKPVIAVRPQSTQPATQQTVPNIAPAISNAPPAVSTSSAREAPGPQINIPQLVDTRYYVVKELDAPPQTLRKPEPVYPPQAEDQGVSGSVLLRLHLEADGSISQSEVISSTPGGVFGELFRKSALDSVKALRFRAAKRNGLPVRALLEFRVVFEQDTN